MDLQILRATKRKIIADYAIDVHSAISSLAQCALKTELYSRSALRQVANKLPPVMRVKWSEEIYKRLPEGVTLLDFYEWLTTKTRGKDWDVWFHGPRQDHKTTESKDDKRVCKLRRPKRRKHRWKNRQSISSPPTLRPAAVKVHRPANLTDSAI